MKKILILTSTFPKWKKNSLDIPFVYELSRRLTDKFNVYVLAPYSKGSKKLEIINDLKIFKFQYWFNQENNLADGAIIPNLKKNKLLWIQVPFFILSEFLMMKKIIQKYKMETIHAHWIIPQGFIAVLYKKLFNPKLKIIITSHGGDIFGLQYLNFLKRWIINNCDTLTVVSNAIKNEILKLNTNKNIPIKIIPMGVDTNSFNPDGCNQNIRKKYNINGPLLLFVGRLSEKKGIKYLIQAIPKILVNFPKTKLLIVGKGEEESELKKTMNHLSLSENIIFTGAIENKELPAYYIAADIFIGPSIITKDGDREGFGLVFAEALSSNCVTISTDLPSISDIIINNKTGFTVKQKNPDEISNKVIEILKNNNKKIIIAGRKHIVDNFDWKIIAQKYSNLVKRID